MMSEHKLVFCSTCLQHQDLYIQEQQSFTSKALAVHMSVGNKAVGFNGHPSCDFCPRSRFYSKTELFQHLTKKHYECDICEKGLGVQYRYYRDYDDLETHFKKDHYLCDEEECLLKKFVVFNNSIDFQAHVAEEHPHRNSNKKAGKKIDIKFNYRRANRDGSGLSDMQKDVTREQAAALRAGRELSPPAAGDEVPTVADFPLLADEEESVGSMPGLHLWHHQRVSIPHTQDFPALESNTATAPAGFRSSRGFRNAVRPPAGPALAAHTSNDSWNYPSLATKKTTEDPLAMFRKTPKVKKMKKKNLKMQMQAMHVHDDEKKQGQVEEKRLQDQGNVIAGIRQVLNGPGAFLEFKSICAGYRNHTIPSYEFYSLLKSLFIPQDFNEQFPKLMSLLNDEKQRKDAMECFNADTGRLKQPHVSTGRKQQPTASSSVAKAAVSDPVKKKNVQRKKPANGWAAALGGYNAQQKPASSYRLQVGHSAKKTTNTTQVKSSMVGNDPATSQVAVHAQRNAPDTKVLFASTTTTSVLDRPVAPPAPARNRADFPSLPTPSAPTGRVSVTRNTWEAQTAQLTEKKGKKKNGKMGLGQFAMQFK